MTQIMKNSIILICILMSSNINAIDFKAYYRGSDLLELCKHYINKTKFSIGRECAGYVKGINDFYNSMSARGKLKLLCGHQDVNEGELVRIVTKYLQEHPEGSRNAASDEVSVALLKAFPCN